MLNSVLIHWRALGLLFGSLLTSIALAVGHHLYYQSLAGEPVSTANDLASWAGVSSQKVNTAVGNTFASIFRTFLTITVTTAYLQVVWRSLKSKGKGTKLNVVDAISGILTNPIGLFNGGAWKKSAILLPLAITIWLLPIAPIITPATLTVETVSQISQVPVNVSSIDFNGLNFAALRDGFHGPTHYYYDGPQFEVQRIATSATGLGIMPLTAPLSHLNISYTQNFAGPALQCSDVRDPLRGQIMANVTNTRTWYAYLAWAPTGESSLPFDWKPGSSYPKYELPAGHRPAGGPPLTLFVAAFPNINDPYRTAFNYTTNATIVECNLMNATYQSLYNWTNSILDLNFTATFLSDGIPYPSNINDTRYLFKNGLPMAWSGVPPQPGNAAWSRIAPQPLSDYDNTLIRNIAYVSVMDAFMGLVKGTIYYPPRPGPLFSTTSVMNTALGNTKELMALWTRFASGQDLASVDPEIWPGVSVQRQANSTLDLRATLEQMFQNVTMSLLSSPLLRPDPATPYYPPAVEVTITTYHNRYAYSAALLWLAYGTAILIATITVIMGCFAIFSSGRSYSSSFSTVLRTTSHASVSTTISRDDDTGQDPLPKHLAEATITFDRIDADRTDAEEEEAVKEHLVVKRDHELGPGSSRSERFATW